MDLHASPGKLGLMAEMGFQDAADNRAALTAAEGDVEVTPMPQEHPWQGVPPLPPANSNPRPYRSNHRLRWRCSCAMPLILNS